MTNYVDLSKLPICTRGIDWKNSYGCIVPFLYRNHTGELMVLDCPDLDRIRVRYDKNEYIITKEALKRCCLGKLFHFAVTDNFKYDVGDIVEDNDSPLLILDCLRLTNKRIKGYRVRCLTCDYEFNVREGNLNKGDRCPACRNLVTVKGKNDIWTTDPDIAKYLTNPEDGYKFVRRSNKKVDCTCPDCNYHIGLKILSDITTRGLSCPRCGDGISYPNRFLRNVLDQLNVNYIPECTFDWCSFPDYNNPSKIAHGIYDCCIPDLRVIIEMDGGLGHGNICHSRSTVSKEESIYKDKCKDMCAYKNGYTVIRIDCFYKGHENKFHKCKNSLIQSELSKIFDFSNIDWKKIDLQSQKSMIYEIAAAWENGLSSGEISERYKLSLSTVIDYLHRGNELNLCNYTPYKRRRK